MRYVMLLLIAGCSTMPMSELENQYFQCTASGAQGCNLIAEEMDRRYEQQAKREKRNASYCDRIDVTCVSGAEFRNMMTRTRH